MSNAPKYYVYTHRRPDTGDVFYVGRGMVYKGSSGTRRANNSKKRSSAWHGVVKKNGGEFQVEIVCWCETVEDVLEQERLFIKQYGRKMNGSGTLVNLTEGGDGALGLKHTEETKKKLRNAHARNPCRARMFADPEFIRLSLAKKVGQPSSMLGKTHSQEARALMSKQRTRSLHVNAMKVVDGVTGAEYGCVSDAADAVGINKWILYKELSGKRPPRTEMRYAR